MSSDRLKRLIYRSCYTGTKELDLVLGAFARARLGDLDAPQLDRYERLLEAENPDIHAWVFDRETPPAEHDTDVLGMVRSFARTSRP
jgi:antitoxin CptB